MPNTALITGASSGIGWELAKYHASKGGDLIITARREDKLNNLKAEIEENYDVKVKIIPLDLAVQGGAAALYKKVKATGKTIEILINNAGFGGHGIHIERELEQEEKMMKKKKMTCSKTPLVIIWYHSLILVCRKLLHLIDRQVLIDCHHQNEEAVDCQYPSVMNKTIVMLEWQGHHRMLLKTARARLVVLKSPSQSLITI